MRLFIALDMPKNVSGEIREVQRSLHETEAGLSITKPGNLHITLKFLGEVGDKRKDDVVKLVSEALESFKAFRVNIEGVGYFGKGNRVSVVWAGVKAGKKELIEIIESLDEKTMHIRKNEFKASPHMTIARVRTGRGKEALLKEIKSLSDVKFGEFDVKEIMLKCSDLTKRGPVYTDVECFRLREDG